jgi:hypothetical protein
MLIDPVFPALFRRIEVILFDSAEKNSVIVWPCLATVIDIRRQGIKFCLNEHTTVESEIQDVSSQEVWLDLC